MTYYTHKLRQDGCVYSISKDGDNLTLEYWNGKPMTAVSYQWGSSWVFGVLVSHETIEEAIAAAGTVPYLEPAVA